MSCWLKVPPPGGIGPSGCVKQDGMDCGGGSCSSAGCFLPGTKVATNTQDSVNIENLKPGNKIIGFAEDNQEIKESTVSAIHQFDRDYYFELETASGDKVQVTAEHPFFVGQPLLEIIKPVLPSPTTKTFSGYKTAEELRLGDQVYIVKGDKLAKTKIIQKQKISGPVKVYNLSVDNTQNFIANNFAVHNKLDPTPPWSPHGTRLRFLFFPNKATVPWPVTSTVGATAWVENALTNQCDNPDAALAQTNIETRMYAVNIWQGQPALREVVGSGEWPTCNNDDHASQVRGHIERTDYGRYASWLNWYTLVSIPAASPYRQFGLRILDGFSDANGNGRYDEGEDNPDAARPVYANVYTWLDENNRKNHVCREEWFEGFQNYPTLISETIGGKFVHHGVKADGSNNCQVNSEGVPKELWPGFPGNWRIYIGGYDAPDYRMGWAVRGYTSHDGVCSGTPSIGYPLAQTECPSGYTIMRASDRTPSDGDCLMLSPHTRAYTGLCPITPGDGTYTDEGGEYGRLGCPRVYTCKRIVGGQLYSRNWKPERGSAGIHFNPDSWTNDIQRIFLYQDFDFTVDKTGNYYFVLPPQQKCADASLAVTGKGNGWDNQHYLAGQVYHARFEIRSSGDHECAYTLGVASKSTIPNETTSLDTILYVPLISKIPPTGNIQGRFKDATGLTACPEDDFDSRDNVAGGSATIVRFSDNLPPSLGTCTPGNPYSCTHIPLDTYKLANITVPVGWRSSGLVCKSNTAFIDGTNSITFAENETVTANLGLWQNFGPWWQSQDGDILGGSIFNPIPSTCTSPLCSPFVSLTGTGGYPGVIAYSDSYSDDALGSTAGSPSETGWLVQQTAPSVSLSYQSLLRGVSSVTDIAPYVADNKIAGASLANLTGESGGYLKYEPADPSTTLEIIGDLNAYSKKIVLFVKGNLEIKQKVTYTKGTGMVVFVVSGNISIDPTVGGGSEASPDLMGVFFAEGTFNSGHKASGADSHLWAKGSIVALGGINFQRTLDPSYSSGNNNNTPAETIIFDPTIYFTFPQELKGRYTIWEQIAD